MHFTTFFVYDDIWSLNWHVCWLECVLCNIQKWAMLSWQYKCTQFSIGPYLNDHAMLALCKAFYLINGIYFLILVSKICCCCMSPTLNKFAIKLIIVSFSFSFCICWFVFVCFFKLKFFQENLEFILPLNKYDLLVDLPLSFLDS